MGASDRLTVGLLAAQLMARVPGGTGRYTSGVLEALAATSTPERSVAALLPLGPLPAGLPPVAVRRVPGPDRVLARLWERGWPPRLGGVDVVHAPTLLVPPVSGSTRLVVTVHDVVPWSHPQTLTPRGVAFHRRMAERAARTAAVVVAPTHTVASSLREVLGAGVDLRAIPPFLPQLPPAESSGSLRTRLGVPGGTCSSSGRRSPARASTSSSPPWPRRAWPASLVVVGPRGWGDVHVDSLAAAAGVADRVRVTGRVDDAALAGLYDGARVVAVPSRAEGFGLPVVEAMARGVPVVTSDDPALVEVGGGATLVTPVADVDALATALATAAAPGPERERLVQAGRERAATYSADVTVDALWSLYAEVAGVSTGRGPTGGSG